MGKTEQRLFARFCVSIKSGLACSICGDKFVIRTQPSKDKGKSWSELDLKEEPAEAAGAE